MCKLECNLGVDCNFQQITKQLAAAGENETNMKRNFLKTLAIACAVAVGTPVVMAETPAMLARGHQSVQQSAEGTESEAETYDYEYLNIPVLCASIWYGSLMNTNTEDHTTQGFQTILGTKALGSDGMPQNESTVYSFLTFQYASVDQKEPMPATGDYTMSNKEGDMVIENSAMIYQRDGNGNYEWERKVTDGHLKIFTTEADGYTYWNYDLVLVDELGKKHHVTYKSRFVEYDDQSQMYGTNRLTKNLDLKIKDMFAYYKGLDESGKTMKVNLFLSDLPKDDPEYGGFDMSDLPGTQFHTEMYVPFSADGVIANGTYTVTPEYGADFTICPGEIVAFAGIEYAAGSYAEYIGKSQDVHWGVYESGTVTIAGEGKERTITAEFMTPEKYSVKFNYKGEIPTLDGMPDSGLTENKVLDLTDAKATFEYYADHYGYGGEASTWLIKILPTGDRKDGMQTELSTKARLIAKGILTGTYTASRSTNLWPGEYLKGRKTESLLVGTWYMGDFDEEGLPHTYAPSTGGDLKVTNHGDGKYTIEFEFSDGVNHIWKGAWSGTPEIIEKVSAVDDINADGNMTVQGRDIILPGEHDLCVADTQGRVLFRGMASGYTLPSAGLYIIVVDSKASKVIVK